MAVTIAEQMLIADAPMDTAQAKLGAVAITDMCATVQPIAMVRPGMPPQMPIIIIANTAVTIVEQRLIADALVAIVVVRTIVPATIGMFVMPQPIATVPPLMPPVMSIIITANTAVI